MSLNDAIKSITAARETIYKEMCDRLQGDCNLCPFKANCVAQSLEDVLLDVEAIKYDLKELIEKNV